LKRLYIFFLLIIFSCSSVDESEEIDDLVPEKELKDIASLKGKFIGNLMRDGFFNDHQINN
jgi:hypothetical protein